MGSASAQAMTLPSCVFPGTCPNLSGPLTDYSTASRAWGKDQSKNWASSVHITTAQAPHGLGCLIQNLLCLCSSISASGSPQWELGSALPGFLGTSGRCPGLRPGPGMSRKPSHRHTKGRPAWTLPVLPGAGEGRGACLLGLLVTKRPVAGSGHTAEPPETQAPPPPPLGLCPVLLPVKGCRSHTFPALLRDPGQRPGAQWPPILGREEGGSRPWGTGCCSWSPSCQVGDLS